LRWLQKKDDDKDKSRTAAAIVYDGRIPVPRTRCLTRECFTYSKYSQGMLAPTFLHTSYARPRTSTRVHVPCVSVALRPVSITAARCVAWRCVASDSHDRYEAFDYIRAS